MHKENLAADGRIHLLCIRSGLVKKRMHLIHQFWDNSMMCIPWGFVNTMADNYFQLSWDEVKKLQTKGKLVQVNQIQCRLLMEKLWEILRNVLEDIHSLPTSEQPLFCKQHCKTALHELCRVTTEAAAIVRACSNKDCLHAAVKLVDTTETFVAFFFQLEWCADVIGIVASASRTDNASLGNLQREMIDVFTVEKSEGKMKVIRSMLYEAASEDHGSLIKRLQELQKRGGKHKDEQERKLIANLLKLKPTPFDYEGNSRAFLQNIEPTELRSLKKIGAGSSGVVWKVHWLGQSFARKTVGGTLTHEAEILARMSHPYIVRLFGVSTHKGQDSSLVMELMSEDLHNCIRNRSCDQGPPFPLDVALDIMLQIAEGMEYLHHKRIVHRDLKSSNILVDPVDNSEMAKRGYLRVKVTDFGLAKIKTSSLTFSLQSKVGTTKWMAPELHRSVGESSEPGPPELRYPFKADVYSYAVTCSEILTGDNPFHGKGPLCGLIERIKSAGLRPGLPDSLPPYLASLIKKCWDAEPCNRPAFSEICTELRHLKASLMIGGEQLVQALHSFPPHPVVELRERKTMYKAFLAAADVETNHVAETLTRVLVIGSSTKLLLDLAPETTGLNNEWKHPKLPLCIHVCNGRGDNGQLECIKYFLKERNSSCNFSSWLAKWTVSLRENWDHPQNSQQPWNNSNRIHAVWILYPVYESVKSKWTRSLKQILSVYELPFQILIADSDSDLTGEHLQKNFLTHQDFLFPNVQALPDHFILVPSKSPSSNVMTDQESEDLQGPMIHHPQMIRKLKQLDHKALWASSEVINTIANIERTAQIIWEIASVLGKTGINIAITAYTTLPKSYTLAQSGIFTLKCLCEIFGVPKLLEMEMSQKLVSWELGENGESGTTPFSIGNGKYLHFSIRVAAVILYFKALHCKRCTCNGFSDTNYLSELDNFYAAYGNRFDELAKYAHFGTSSQVQHILLCMSSDRAAINLKQQLQISLENFFVNMLNCSP